MLVSRLVMELKVVTKYTVTAVKKCTPCITMKSNINIWHIIQKLSKAKIHFGQKVTQQSL